MSSLIERERNRQPKGARDERLFTSPTRRVQADQRFQEACYEPRICLVRDDRRHQGAQGREVFGLEGENWMRHGNPLSVDPIQCLVLDRALDLEPGLDRLVLPDPDRSIPGMDDGQPAVLLHTALD